MLFYEPTSTTETEPVEETVYTIDRVNVIAIKLMSAFKDNIYNISHIRYIHTCSLCKFEGKSVMFASHIK